MKKDNLALISLITLMIVVLISGTIAFWTQELQVMNEFEVAFYDTLIYEEFESPSGWLPGVKVDKKVKIVNDSSIPIVVKVIFNQNWMQKSQTVEGQWINLPLVFDNGSGKNEYAALLNFNKENVRLLASGVSSHANLSYGLMRVDTLQQALGKWLLIDETPDSDGNLYFYFIGYINAKSDSPWLLDSVTMNPKINTFITHKFITYVDDGYGNWIQNIEYIENPTVSFDSSTYTLSIKARTVQATKPAILEIFSEDEDIDVVNYLADYVGELKLDNPD